MSPSMINPDDYVSKERQQELITCADRGLCETAVRMAIREAVAAVLAKAQQPIEPQKD